MGLNLSKFYAFFAFFILIFAGCADEKGSAFFNGYVEGDYLYIAPSVSGRIVNLSVKEGTTVQEGEPLFALESAEAVGNLDAAKANIDALEAELADLSTGKRPEEIERINEPRPHFGSRRLTTIARSRCWPNMPFRKKNLTPQRRNLTAQTP